MAHIDLKSNLPGIRGPMMYSPETAKPLNELAEVLLRDENNSLSRGERELIGAYVSSLNSCFFCENVHGAIAGFYLGWDTAAIDRVNKDMNTSDISPKMKTLLAIAGHVRDSGKSVTKIDIEDAKAAGATDKEIHDAVLIAAAFCMFNRYVDGLGTSAPEERQFYVERAPRRAAEGYVESDLTK